MNVKSAGGCGRSLSTAIASADQHQKRQSELHHARSVRTAGRAATRRRGKTIVRRLKSFASKLSDRQRAKDR